jgi:hypothetical protein
MRGVGRGWWMAGEGRWKVTRAGRRGELEGDEQWKMRGGGRPSAVDCGCLECVTEKSWNLRVVWPSNHIRVWGRKHLNLRVACPSQSHPCVRGKALEPSFSITSVCEGESARVFGL